MMYCANNTTARKIAHSLPIFLDTYRRRRGFHSQSVSKLADVFPALLLLLTDLAGGRSSFLHYRELRNSLRSRCRRLHRSLRLWKLRRKYAKMWERSHTKSREEMSRSVAIARLVGRSSRRSSAALVASSSPPLSSSIDAGEVWCNRRVLHSRAFTSDQQAAAAKWTQEAKASSSGGAAAGGREQSSSSAQTAAESFAAATAKMVYATVSQGFQTATASAESAFHKVRETKFVDSMKTSYSFLREELSNTAPRRRRTRAAAAAGPPPAENTQVTAVVPVVKKTTRWEKQWESLKEKAWAHPAFRQLKTAKEHPVVTKGQELAEDLRERWETSDSPVVHKIQDLNESIFGETATAVAMREIRQHDPSFSITEFILEVQEDVRPVLRAYLKGDLNVLRERCSREVVERCRAERQALESQGIFLDNKILHISDVEVKDTKLLGNSPIIIVAFQTQQIYCARDRDGNITEGAKDEIHTVHYAWAMQQVIPGEMQEFDIHRRWKLREMQQLGIQALI